MKTFEKMTEIRAKRDELMKELRSLASDVFRDDASSLFVKHPTMEQFSWTQYTPYFNDGDECTFSAHTDAIYIKFTKDSDEEDDEDEGDYFSSWSVWRDPGDKYYIKDDAVRNAAKDVLEFMGNFDDETLKELFGDHCRVVVSRDGAEAEDYSHD